MSEIVMPRLTDSMEEGSILTWLKSDGDEIAVGDELVEIETDKASMVYESDLAGTLEILVPEGETRPIGEPIANVGDGSSSGGGASGEGGSSGRTSPGVPAEPPSPNASEQGDSQSRGKAGSDGGSSETRGEVRSEVPPLDPAPPNTEERIRVSPLARRIAEEKSVDLASLTGSGPGGRIIKIDVEGASPAGSTNGKSSSEASSPDSAKGTPKVVELNRTQQVIARRMSESKATVPHFYLRTQINMDRAMEVRSAFKSAAAEGDPVPSLNDFVVKASALALKRHPRANAAFRDGHFELYPKVNIGIAVATEGSLIVPVIRDADQSTLSELGAESRRLAERVRSGEITPPELAGGTFTVSNLGMFGVSSFDAVINPGQAGILSVGEVAKRPVVTDQGIEAAHLMELTLACDHRILYGADGAEFLASVKSNLEEPGLLA